MALTLDGTTGISATGNIYGNNIIVTNSLTAGSFAPALLSSTGNVTGGNLLTGGIVSAIGNIAGSYFIGNGSQLTGVDATQIINGTSNVKVNGSGGNITHTVAGTANVGVWYNAGLSITGDLTVTGNATLSGNILGDRIQNGTTLIDIQTANGNANITVGGTSNVAVYATTGVFITGVNSVSGNVTGGNLLTGGLISATSNIQGGNLRTAGIVSATGNITGSYILGNGSQLTGVDATQIINGTSNARVVSSGGNIAVGIGGTANVAVFATTGAFVTGLISATGAITGGAITGSSLTVTTGNITGGNLILSGAIIDSAQLDIQTSASNANIVFTPNGTGNVNMTTGLSVTGNITGGNLRTAGLISATGTITSAGNITGGNLILSGAITDSAQLDIQTSAANANIVLTPNGTGNVNISSNIMPTSSNATANIGGATAYFNTVFGKATTAQYADLAELYSADAMYAPGTVLDFGGTNEVTISSVASSARVAGVVSTNPAHLMNSVLESEHKVAVALQGRVPTSVVGTIRKGDMMVTAGNGRARAEANPAMGTVIGKALEDFDGVSGTIEIVVGRL
jgi:hypothetical protein